MSGCAHGFGCCCGGRRYGWTLGGVGGGVHPGIGALFDWEQASRGSVPPGAVRAGTDHGNQPVYAGRAPHMGDLIPAKVAPAYNCAFVPWGGREHSKLNYEVLTTQHSVRWIPDCMGRVPKYAVSTGQTRTGEPLYLGRAHHNGTLLPGKIHPSHKCLYLPYGDMEYSYSNYEVLVILPC